MRESAFFLIMAFLGFFSASARADYLDKNGILREFYGAVRLMSHQEALLACPPGTHLPTAREFAATAQSLGAKGILELSALAPGEAPPEGYYLIEAENADGVRDTFFYNIKGYINGNPPDSDLVKHAFWASSFSPSEIWDFAYNFFGDNGSIYFGQRDGKYHQLAVRCFR